MSDGAEDKLTAIRERRARVAVVGLGYVGESLASCAQQAGFPVIGIEIDPERLNELRASGRFDVTDDHAAARDADVVVICVPTPLLAGAPDLSAINEAADALAPHLQRGTLVVLESTTYPGATEEILRPRLEAGGLKAGQDFALAYSPERIDPGNRRFTFRDIPKVVGGLDADSAALAEEFYGSFVEEVVVVPNPRAAELAKLLENTYRQVNIALANEFAMVAHELDIDIWEVIDAAATKPFGFEPFYPGVGVGGHCIAVDPVYLTWRIRELGRGPFRLVELAREVDDSMPLYVTKRIQQVLADAGVALRGAKVLALGVTYKPDVADTRESRAIEVIEHLAAAGAEVRFHDPYVEELRIGDDHYKRAELEAALAEADLVAILTHHSAYDWNEIVASARLVFDARGVTRAIEDSKISRL